MLVRLALLLVLVEVASCFFSKKPAFAQQRIGVVVLTSVGLEPDAYFEPFKRGLSAATKQPTVVQTTAKAPEDVASEADRLLDLHGVEVLAVTGRLMEVRRIAQKRPDVLVFHLDSAGAVGEVPPNVVRFSFLPQDERQFLTKYLAATKGAVVVGPSYAPQQVEFLYKAIAVASPQTLQHKINPNRPADAEIGALMQLKPTAVGGTMDEAFVGAFARTFLAKESSTIPLLLFSPPPPQTRAYLAGRYLALALNKGNAPPEQLIQRIAEMGRFDREQRAINLPWSIREHNLNATIVRSVGRPEFFYRATQQGADNTQECSCNDGNGREVSCKQCEPGKCKVFNDNTPNCWTECSTK